MPRDLRSPSAPRGKSRNFASMTICCRIVTFCSRRLANSHGVALVGHGGGGTEVAYERHADRRVRGVGVVDILDQRRLGDSELVLYGARLILGDLGRQRAAHVAGAGAQRPATMLKMMADEQTFSASAGWQVASTASGPSDSTPSGSTICRSPSSTAPVAHALHRRRQLPHAAISSRVFTSSSGWSTIRSWPASTSTMRNCPSAFTFSSDIWKIGAIVL